MGIEAGACYQVSTTAGSPEEARELARSSVRERLAACGQVIGPITSAYWWENQLDETEEWLVLLKTTDDRRDDLIKHLRSAHSYQVPEIICTPVSTGDPTYLAWVLAETRRP